MVLLVQHFGHWLVLIRATQFSMTGVCQGRYKHEHTASPAGQPRPWPQNHTERLAREPAFTLLHKDDLPTAEKRHCLCLTDV